MGAEGGFIEGLLQFGALGLIVAWFALRQEKLMQAQTNEIRRNTQVVALVLQVITFLQAPQVPQELRKQAEEKLRDITKNGGSNGA